MRGPDDRQRIRFEVVPAAYGVLGVAVVSLVIWLVDEGGLEVGVAVALFAAVATDAALAWSAVSRGDVRVLPPSVLVAGLPSTWQAGVVGTRRPVSLRLHLVGPTQDVIAVDGRSGSIALPPLLRGQVPFLVLDLTSRGPLGLVTAGRRVLVRFPVPVPVAPPASEVEVTWPKVRAAAFGLHERTPVGDDLFRTVRPYRRGDPPRRVHWKATAHHGQLMVKELDGLGVVRVRIVADLGRPGPRAERVARDALGLVGQALDRGWSVELVTRDAGDVLPQLASIGQAFRALPVVTVPHVPDLPTVAAPVTDRGQAARRLARAGYGTPSTAGRRADLVCRVTPDGVVWG
ncbi:MAG: DUF58 domain-containing protein [Acidimicrobiales bacterium]